MKKLLYILLLLTSFVNAQIVLFPDVNFKNKLMSANTSNAVAQNSVGANIVIDTNSDGEIQLSEVLQVYKLDVSSASITDMTGIMFFTNINRLNCSNNELTTLNISSLNNLEYLNCENNLLTNLNVTSLTNLLSLNCASNQIASIDVSSLINLELFNCTLNQLTSLNVSNLTSLTHLFCINNLLTTINVTPLTNLIDFGCSENPLTTLNVSTLVNLQFLHCETNMLSTLDVSNLVNLKILLCGTNNLTTLDLSNLVNLEYLQCSENAISSIDLSNLTLLQKIYCNNNLLATLNLSNSPLLTTVDCSLNPNLTSLYIKNGAIESVLQIENCPILAFICADDNQVNTIEQITQANGYNCTVNSYCTITPGGNFNTITGTMIFDSNNNGCDVSDLPYSNIKININDGTTSGATFTNSTGNYTFNTQAGNFTLTPAVENPSFFNFTPTNAVINFPNNNNNVTNQDFCITANGVHPDLEIVLTPIISAQPGFDATYNLVYRNIGNQSLSGNISLGFEDAKMDFISANPVVANQIVNQLTWNYSNLSPFETRVIQITFNINTPTDPTPVNSGDVLVFNSTINPTIVDENPVNNQYTLNQIVINSLDPNDKKCLEGNIVSPSRIGHYLHYNIRFENTGTAIAQNVIVKDIINTAQYDISTLQILSSSHQAITRVRNNTAEIIFQNCSLDSGGHGNVLLKIRTRSSLIAGDEVSNTANIFFDYNSPIDTNQEITKFAILNTTNFEIDNSITVFPNPASSNININCKNNIKSVELYDVQGRLLQTQSINKSNAVLNIAKNANGIYFIKITSDKGVKVEKLIKE